MTSSSRSSTSSGCTRSLQPMTIGQKYPFGSSSRHHHHHLNYPPPQQRTMRRRSCLRKESAFACGGASRGSRLDELSATKMITVSYAAKPKKSLSFADQRGQHLVLEREFCPADAPVCYCDVPIEVTVGRKHQRSSSFDQWMEETLARQHLVSMCVVSLLGCALLGLRQTAK